MKEYDQNIEKNADFDLANMRLIYAYLALCTAIILALWLYPRGQFLTIVINPFAPESAIHGIAAHSDSQIIDLGRVHWLANLYAPESNAVERLYSAGAFLVFRNYAPTTCLQEVQP